MSRNRSAVVLDTIGAALFVLLVLARPALAQQQQSNVDELRQEMEQMRHQYDAVLKKLRHDYETRLNDMEKRLKTAEDTAIAAKAAAATAQQQAEQAATTPPAAASPAATAAAGPIGTTPTGVPGAPGAGAAASNGAGFNPAIGVVLDGKFTSLGRDPATYKMPGFMLGDSATPQPNRGFALGESEVSFSSNIDQDLYGSLIVSIEREGTVNVEEGYLQTTSLPYGFTVKAGRFFSGIGYLNEQHAHTWDFADAPLPYLAFLNQQLGDDGVQVRWLAPTDMFVEFGAELARGDAFPAANAANRGIGTYSAFVHVGDDINESSSYRTGLSYLHTKAADRVTGSDTFTGDDNTGIADFVYKWAPEGNPVERNFKLQGEYFVRRERGVFDKLDYNGLQTGWYAQAVYQFMPRWRVGIRHDQVYAHSLSSQFAGTTLDNLGDTPMRNSIMVDYSTSEFGRFRLQYNRDQARPAVDNQIILQYTVSLGAHGAHIF